jgi:hypothetical protein
MEKRLFVVVVAILFSACSMNKENMNEISTTLPGSYIYETRGDMGGFMMASYTIMTIEKPKDDDLMAFSYTTKTYDSMYDKTHFESGRGEIKDIQYVSKNHYKFILDGKSELADRVVSIEFNNDVLSVRCYSGRGNDMTMHRR